ncbi:MAG: YheC/YheD family protein [Paenibacillaceae bacterium]|nr:YheC/YheD family protein [Paenibacillaceae bacterium]
MGKWELHRFYAKDGAIARHMPAAAPLNKRSFLRLLTQYGSVYVKPNYEHRGAGIMKAWRNAEGNYIFVRVRGRRTQLRTLNDLYAKVRNGAAGRRHIVQRTIDLAQIGGRSYDVRVMMVRGGSGAWQYVGMLAKVAGPGSVVTNVSRGRGYALAIEPALSRSLGAQPARIAAIKRQLVHLSYRISRRFNAYKYTAQIGIDYGVDKQGRIWLIEVNFDYPSHVLFKRLADKTMFRDIKRTLADYRRIQKRFAWRG